MGPHLYLILLNVVFDGQDTEIEDVVRHVTGTGSGLLGGIPRVVVQISSLTLKGPL